MCLAGRATLSYNAGLERLGRYLRSWSHCEAMIGRGWLTMGCRSSPRGRLRTLQAEYWNRKLDGWSWPYAGLNRKSRDWLEAFAAQGFR